MFAYIHNEWKRFQAGKILLRHEELALKIFAKGRRESVLKQWLKPANLAMKYGSLKYSYYLFMGLTALTMFHLLYLYYLRGY